MALSKKEIIRLNLTGIVLLAFIAVSCSDSMAEDTDNSDWTDDSNESTDPKDSQKKETEKSSMPMKFSIAAPGWTCYPGWYGTDDGCDCGCGVVDPDCSGTSSDACDYNWCDHNAVNPTQNNLCEDNTIKIMPVGDSITAGQHFGYPALGQRTGYRKELYEHLIDDGNDVDFVGTQKHGNDLPYDWNNEAYPGKDITFIANKLEDALPTYKPDVLLVHVGTNGSNWSRKPQQVMDMLDMINDFSTNNNHPMVVFLCKIINRTDGGHTLTTDFNNSVADLVAARSGDEIDIIMVDMENGASLDYSDEPPLGDMLGDKYEYPDGIINDPFHPNDKGNAKMADLFFDELLYAGII